MTCFVNKIDTGRHLVMSQRALMALLCELQFFCASEHVAHSARHQYESEAPPQVTEVTGMKDKDFDKRTYSARLLKDPDRSHKSSGLIPTGIFLSCWAPSLTSFLQKFADCRTRANLPLTGSRVCDGADSSEAH